jgi:uncharacterized membrane protein YfhO
VSSTGALPAITAPGTPVKVSYPDPASWRLSTDATSPQVLRMRLTDVPGWHATIDGKPLDLQRFAGVMLQARVPSGHHVIELSYWPGAFTLGIVLAICAALGLLAAIAIAIRNRRRASLALERSG